MRIPAGDTADVVVDDGCVVLDVELAEGCRGQATAKGVLQHQQSMEWRRLYLRVQFFNNVVLLNYISYFFLRSPKLNEEVRENKIFRSKKILSEIKIF